MSHIPVNHPLRPLYRVLAALAGLYVLAFGIVGISQTAGSPLFDRGDATALGLPTNLAFAVVSVIAGLVVLAAVFAGRNLDATVTLWAGGVFMAVGTALLALIRTDLNVLNFSLATVIVSFSIGLLLFSAGLYTRSARTSARPQPA